MEHKKGEYTWHQSYHGRKRRGQECYFFECSQQTMKIFFSEKNIKNFEVYSAAYRKNSETIRKYERVEKAKCQIRLFSDLI